MRSKFLEAFNAVNLLRNGGLDLGRSGMPPFWQLIGAKYGSGSDRCIVVRGEPLTSAQGAANYFKTTLTSPNAVTLRYAFASKFIQMAFARELSEAGSLPSKNIDTERMPPAYDKEDACQRVVGEVSLSLSVRVPAGTARITVVMVRRGGEEITKVVYPAMSSKDWARPTLTFDLDVSRAIMDHMNIIVQRVKGDIAEVHVGAVMLAGGAYSHLPYTGDPMADAIPRDALVFAVGTACPPGFEKVVLSSPDGGRAYIRGVPNGDLSVEGLVRHGHAAQILMDPEHNWSYMWVESGYLEFTNSYYGGNPPLADLAEKAHTHELSTVSAVPPSRDVIMCRRL